MHHDLDMDYLHLRLPTDMPYCSLQGVGSNGATFTASPDGVTQELQDMKIASLALRMHFPLVLQRTQLR